MTLIPRSLATTVSGNPDHFAGKPCASEDFIRLDLDVVNGSVVQMDPEAALLAERIVHLFQPRPKHSQKAVESSPCVSVGGRPLTSLAFFLACATCSPGIVGRIYIDQIKSSNGVFGKRDAFETIAMMEEVLLFGGGASQFSPAVI